MTLSYFADAVGISKVELELISKHVKDNPQLNKAFSDFCLRAKLILMDELAADARDRAEDEEARQEQQNLFIAELTEATTAWYAERDLTQELYAFISVTSFTRWNIPDRFKEILKVCLEQRYIKESLFTNRLFVAVKPGRRPTLATAVYTRYTHLENIYYRDYQ